MNKLFIKNGTILPLKNIKIVKDGFRIFNPSEEMIIEDGWVPYIQPQVLPQYSLEDMYKLRIVDLIRQRYSMDDELAIQRQRDIKTKEFDEYNQFTERCKEIAYNEIYGESEV